MIIFFFFWPLLCYGLRLSSAVRVSHRLNPLGMLQQVAQLPFANQENLLQQISAPTPPVAPALPTMANANITAKDIQAMESGAAATAQQNLKLDKDLMELESHVLPLEKRIASLRDQGELDKKKTAKLRKFQDSVSPATLLNSIASLGANPASNGIFEAPIVFLQPSAPTLTEKFQLDDDTRCADEMIQDNEKMETLAADYTDIDDPRKLDEELEKLRKEFAEAQQQGKTYETEKEELEKLVNEGDGKEEKELKTVQEKIHANEVKMEDIRLRITALRLRKEQAGTSEKEGSEGIIAGNEKASVTDNED